MFKTMGYSPGSLLRNRQFRTLSNSPEIDTNSPARTKKGICKHVGGLSGSLVRFPGLTKIRHVQNHGLYPRVFAEKPPISDPFEFASNGHELYPKVLDIHLQACNRLIGDFGAICRTYQNPPCSKPWAIAQAFCSKTANFGPFRIYQNRYKQSRKDLQRHLQACRRRFREFGAISRTYQNPPCSKPWAIAQAFCSKTANLGTSRIQPESIKTVPQDIRKAFASL